MSIEIKEFLKFILYGVVDFTINSTPKITPKTLFLIRLDAIGDYILFRNFIEILKRSPRYRDYRITLVGNIAWKDLAEHLDRNFVNEFIWIDIKKFHRNLIYRYQKLKKIMETGYEILIYPTYSRTLDADFVVRVVNAKEKIGNSGNLSNIKAWQKRITDRWYTELLPAKKEIIFEFYRNKEFFENLLDKKINLKKPYIKLDSNLKLKFDLPEKYAILFIGASAKFRKWSIKNFVKVGEVLRQKYNYEILICGGKEDLREAQEFKRLANYFYIDLVGKTSLTDMLYIIYNGNLMVSNETFAPHMAVALEMTNIFVISNGNHFGRFIPYPKEIWPYYYPIYHPEIEKNLDNYKEVSNRYGCGSKLDINEITIDKVIAKIEEVIG